MANDVRFSIPEQKIRNTGVTFARTRHSEKHGEITVRQNHLIWRPSGNEFAFSVKWELFAEFAEKSGSRTKPKTSVVKAKKRLKAAKASA